MSVGDPPYSVGAGSRTSEVAKDAHQTRDLTALASPVATRGGGRRNRADRELRPYPSPYQDATCPKLAPDKAFGNAIGMPSLPHQDASPGRLLAANVRRLRVARGLSQQKVSALAEVPRPTWASLESGDANPTLSVLTKVARALCVGVEDLLLVPQVRVQLLRAEGLKTTKRGKSTLRTLTPEAAGAFELRRLLLPPGEHFTQRARPAAAQALLTCEIGELEVELDATSYRLLAGDVMLFKSGHDHTLHNKGRGRAVAYAAIAPQPPR